MNVSVIIPTFKRPRQLLECLEALSVQQLNEPWEVIVVDDGTSEPVHPRVERLIASRHWRLIRQDNAGPASARNRGVSEARGDFIAFTDDDCKPEPEWLQRLLRAARQSPAALVGGSTVNGLKSDFFASVSQLIVDFVYRYFNADPSDAFFLASNNILCRREQFMALGGFDASFSRAGAEDRDFCDRWRMRGWPILWRQEARIEHFHAQTFAQFVDLYIRYGRGAYRYQVMRRRRGSCSLHLEFGFHKGLPASVWRHCRGQGRLMMGLATVSALVVWQTANIAGFLFEAVSAWLRRDFTRG